MSGPKGEFSMTRAPRASRLTALTLAAALALPTLAVTAGCGHGNNAQSETNGGPVVSNAPMTPNSQPSTPAPAAKPGLTGKQKVVLLAGAAALFFLYKHYQKVDAAQANAHPQLYREDKGPNTGAIYYRKNDANHTVVWLQAPSQGIQVPADQAQQYLGNGFDPNNPSGYQPQSQINTNPQATPGSSTQSADQYGNPGG